ncbi:hypothetical protein MC885_014321, partial [Smutsia gigantea]
SSKIIPKVTEIIPKYGSINGATRLTIKREGHHNVSFILDSDYGRSFPQKVAYFVSSLNKISMFQTYAEVTMISPSEGSTQRGTMLTINERFFDQTDFPIRVLVGGQGCDILNVTENSICCKTPPKPDILRTVYPGGRGLKLEVRIAYHSSTANSYFSSPTQRSDEILLQKGKEYYIEILLQEYRLSAFVEVGLYQHRSVYTKQQTEDSVNEEQVIKSQSTTFQEIQVITLENWEAMNATSEVRKIMVTTPCVEADSCSLYQYRLIYNMEKTGDFDLLGYEVFEGNNVTLDIREQTKGKPSLDTFTLNWDGITPQPLTS